MPSAGGGGPLFPALAIKLPRRRATTRGGSELGRSFTIAPVRLSFQNICFSLKRTFAGGDSNVSSEIGQLLHGLWCKFSEQSLA